MDVLRQLITGLLLSSALVGISTTSLAGTILPSPHDDHHVISLAPADFVDSKGAAPVQTPESTGAFDQTTHVLSQPLTSEFRVRQAGKYTLWVRIGQARNFASPVNVTLSSPHGTLLEATANHDGSAQKARLAYLEQAQKNTPAGAVPSLEAKRFGIAVEKKPAASSDDIAGELLGEIESKTNKTPKDPWVTLTRVEELSDEVPFAWWKLGAVELQPGRYTLAVNPTLAATTRQPILLPRFDAVFLTTNDKLAYPYVRDIGHSKANFVRFRLDKIPTPGIRVLAAIQTHVLQHPRISAVFGPETIEQDKPLTKTGYTPWYRLQDVEYMPVVSKNEVGMRLEITLAGTPLTPAKGFAGATQFAAFPHPDFIVREFDWNEPTGLNYTVPLDCDLNRHRLMTFRDHAREHYESALAASDRVAPLTRGNLQFIGIGGAMNADDRDYLVKTLRLLGLNAVNEIGDPLPGRKQYGWHGAQFSATLPLGHPFDDNAARKEYEDYFRERFADPKALEIWKDAETFCILDEPGEAYVAQMTAPVWQFRDDAGDQHWFDPIGTSELHTKNRNLGDSVLECTVERKGGVLKFMLGVDNPEEPTHYWYWTLGSSMGPAINSNLAFGEYQMPDPALPGYRYIQALGTNTGKIKVKIVQQGSTATLFVGGKTIHQHLNLPKNINFAISGGIKRIDHLRLRPLAPGEGVSLQEDKAQAEPAKPAADVDLSEFGVSNLPSWAKPKPLRQAVEEDWIEAGGEPVVRRAFRNWAKEQGLTPDFFGREEWSQVKPLTAPFLVQNEIDARTFYWSRKYSGQLTPKKFTMISDAIHKFAPNKQMVNYAALSGGVLYRAKHMPVDMFAMAGYGNYHAGGISDWMFYSTWRWDSHQAVAFSAELFNAGARRHGQSPLSFPMMHCVAPTVFRSYTQIANQVKILSCYSYGPKYFNVPDPWSENPDTYVAVSQIANRSAQCDDILSPGVRRPSRVALLYAISSEYWNPSAFDDKRSTFLGLSHDYYQPEIVTEQQIAGGALKHYDALYVLDPHVADDAQQAIGDWVRGGGLLWSCADALTRDQYNRPADLLDQLAQVKRTFANPVPTEGVGPLVKPAGSVKFRSHTTVANGRPQRFACDAATLLGQYEDGSPAWVEKAAGKGKVVYVGHRAGSSYTSRNILAGGYRELWPDTGRELLTQPLLAAKIDRELILSEPTIMATPTSTGAGTVIILYNMKPNPRGELEVRLKEPQAPHSVETFAGLGLESLPFEYRDGYAVMKLRDFNEGQMIVVRRKPQPADERFEQMQTRTIAQLQSTDPDALSAGTWFAGYHADWQLGDKVVALIDHQDWRVRHAAAEALGRLKHKPAGDRLYAAAQQEKDAHALSQQITALAALRHTAAPELCLGQLRHPNYVVRQQAIRALGSYVPQDAASIQSTLTQAVDQALRDEDSRIRHVAIALVGQLDPARAVTLGMAAFDSRDPQAALDRAAWARAIGTSSAKLLPMTSANADAFHIAVGKHRSDNALADSLVAIAIRLGNDKIVQRDWVAAVLNQRDHNVAERIFALRKKLPVDVREHVTLICEREHEAGLGNSEADWEEFFAQRVK